MYCNQFVHKKLIIPIFIQNKPTKFCDGWWQNGGAEGGGKALVFLEERQKQNGLCCPGGLHGLGHHCSSTHFTVVSSKALRKGHEDSGLTSTVVITVVHWCLPGGEVVSEVILLCLPFGIPVMAHFDSLWRSRHPEPPGPSTIEDTRPGWCRKLKN